MDENEYKLCPVCGSKPEVSKCSTALTCSNDDCPLWNGFYDVEDWQNQPRVDALTAEVTALRAALTSVQEFAQFQAEDLHDDYAAEKMEHIVKMCEEALK